MKNLTKNFYWDIETLNYFDKIFLKKGLKILKLEIKDFVQKNCTTENKETFKELENNLIKKINK